MGGLPWRLVLAALCLLVAVVAAALASLTTRRPEPPTDPPDPRVVPVGFVLANLDSRSHQPTPGGARFPARGGHIGISHLVIGEQRYPMPWEESDWSSSLDTPNGCALSRRAPVAEATYSSFGGNHTEYTTSCSVIPEWIVAQGLRLGSRDYLVVLRTVSSEYRNPWLFGRREEHHEQLIIARGPEPEWRYTVIAGLAGSAPELRERDGVLSLTVPTGVYRLPLAEDRHGGFSPWPAPRRFTSQLSPRWSWPFVTAALLAFCFALLRGLLRARPPARQLAVAPPREASITGRVRRHLELQLASGELLLVRWPSVREVQRSPRGRLVLTDSVSGPLPSSCARIAALIGRHVTLVLESSGVPQGPYRTQRDPEVSLAWVLDHEVTPHDAIRLVRKLALSGRAALIALLIASAAALVASLELWSI